MAIFMLLTNQWIYCGELLAAIRTALDEASSSLKNQTKNPVTAQVSRQPHSTRVVFRSDDKEQRESHAKNGTRKCERKRVSPGYCRICLGSLMTMGWIARRLRMGGRHTAGELFETVVLYNSRD